MSVTTTGASVTYQADGAARTFPIPFRFLAKDDLQVSVASPTGAVSQPAWTLSGTNVVLGSAPASGSLVSIDRRMKLEQATSFSTQGAFSPKTHEAALDRVVMALQQIDGDRAALACKLADDVSRLSSINVAGTADPNTIYVTASGSTTARSLAAHLGDVVNVRAFGAVCDGTTNDTAAIQAAIATGRTAVVSDVCRVAGTLTVGTRQHLHLAGGAQLLRLASDSSTDEVVRMSGSHGRLTGEGEIVTQKASPRGIVRIGQSDAEDTQGVFWNRISGIRISGPDNAGVTGSVGVYLYASHREAGAASTYFNHVHAVQIQDVDEGIRATDVANANSFTDVEFYRVGTYSYHFQRCGQNSVKGGFTHFSSTLASVIKIEGEGWNADGNTFAGVGAEPGGTATYFDLDANTTSTLIVGHSHVNGDPDNFHDAGSNNAWLMGDVNRLGTLQTTRLTGEATDGPTAVGLQFTNRSTLADSGARIAVFYAGGTTIERAWVMKDGSWHGFEGHFSGKVVAGADVESASNVKAGGDVLVGATGKIGSYNAAAIRVRGNLAAGAAGPAVKIENANSLTSGLVMGLYMDAGTTLVADVTRDGEYEVVGVGKGLLLKSPNGTRYRLSVADGGTLSVAAAP